MFVTFQFRFVCKGNVIMDIAQYSKIGKNNIIIFRYAFADILMPFALNLNS